MCTKFQKGQWAEVFSFFLSFSLSSNLSHAELESFIKRSPSHMLRGIYEKRSEDCVMLEVLSDVWGQIILIQMFGIWQLNCVCDWWIALLSYRLKGLIIDAFGELRDQQEQVKEDMEVSFHSTSDLTFITTLFITSWIKLMLPLVLCSN